MTFEEKRKEATERIKQLKPELSNEEVNRIVNRFLNEFHGETKDSRILKFESYGRGSKDRN